VLEGREIVMYGDGTQTRDFTYVDDIVEGLVLARKAPPGAAMNVGGGNRVSLAEAIATLGEVVGVEPKIARRPAEYAWLGGMTVAPS
jgi:UDP-glucuronate 4-epimerase